MNALDIRGPERLRARSIGVAPPTASLEPAIPHGGRGDIAPGHRRDIGWPEVALDSLSGGEEVIVCHPSLPIPTRVISTTHPRLCPDPAWTPWTRQ